MFLTFSLFFPSPLPNLALVSVAESVHLKEFFRLKISQRNDPAEPAVNFLRWVPGVHSHIGAAVDDQVVPQDEGHRVTAPGGRANGTGAELREVIFIDLG